MEDKQFEQEQSEAEPKTKAPLSHKLYDRIGLIRKIPLNVMNIVIAVIVALLILAIVLGIIL